MASLPMIETVDELEERLSRPSLEAVEALAALKGDILILGAGGKIGPTIAIMAARSLREAGISKHIFAVDRTMPPELEDKLCSEGIRVLLYDLLDRTSLEGLPNVENVMFMAGRKFGSTGDEWTTWALNTFLPGLVAERFAKSRIVVFSTGNIYPLTPVAYGGATEDCPPEPVGEYAQSCLGRERIFEHFSAANGTPCLFFRLCYAVELRYGVILDVAEKVYAGKPIDLSMGHLMAIWQGDVAAQALRCFALCQSPPMKLNITGPEIISVRWLANELGRHLEKEPVFEGTESECALVVNAARAQGIFGYPSVPLEHTIRWVAHWIKIGGPTYGKPTHYEQRDGKF